MRRCRNLLFLGYSPDQICGYDIRPDREAEAVQKYGIDTVGCDWFSDHFEESDVAIISTPPNEHERFVKHCVDAGIPCFMESNTYDWGIAKFLDAKSLVAPSCTLRHYKAIQEIKKIIDSKKYGEVVNFVAYFGQDLRQWHPWEKISDFYMSNKNYGGIWENLQYDLVYLTYLFGYPVETHGFVKKVNNWQGLDFYDYGSLIMNYPNIQTAYLNSDLFNKEFERSIIISFEEGIAKWRQGEGLTLMKDSEVIKIPQEETTTVAGYDTAIKEEPYVEELKTFLDAVEGKIKYPYTLDDEIKRLKLLEPLRC